MKTHKTQVSYGFVFISASEACKIAHVTDELKEFLAERLKPKFSHGLPKSN